VDVSDPLLYEQDAWRAPFAWLRAQDPVHYTESSPFGPYWSVTRYEDIVAVDCNHTDFSSNKNIMIGDVGEDLPGESFITMDPPKHDLHRQAVQPVVAPRNLANFEPLIRSRVCSILDSLPVAEPFDWVERVSINLTTQMLATLFDFPFEERSKLTYWSELVSGAPELSGGDVDPQERLAGLMDCLETFNRLWEERLTAEPGNDLISLLQASPDTASIVERPMEFLGTVALLIVGGNDTTRNSITGSVLALNENPGEYAKLTSDHELITSFVPEVIRWQTPLIHMRRTAAADVEFRGREIRKGDKVVMWYLSGNHDEDAIEGANEFRIDRASPRRHLSFGYGIHRCMGNRLGEMQLRILWEEILSRFRHVEVLEAPLRVRSNFVRGYSRMTVKLHSL
jgi:cytochrome P450